MNPRKMAAAMKKMGIAQEEIDATEVIIKCPDKEIVITEPSVAKIKAMGSEQFTISGNVQETQHLKSMKKILKQLWNKQMLIKKKQKQL